ncbi:MAG: 4-hydroxy-tetrahydrodipicolinate reductase [Holosporales bacterium]|jgi:4-hydroxy-tetrahydrodipicolinate reductase|nr:4-hydroxy-tetrahydrodipicolinate reductase [Holosporales bacterium]
MLKIMISGITGRMGKLIAYAINSIQDVTLVGGTSLRSAPGQIDFNGVSVQIGNAPDQIVPKTDVIIDFSEISATEKLLDCAVKYGKALVIGTTGAFNFEKLRQASEAVPVFYSANFSLGIYLINKLIPVILKTLPVEEYDIEILETHHRWKKDLPSGTALTIGQVVASCLGKRLKDIMRKDQSPRNCGELGISSIRGGSAFGEHEIMFLGREETVKIKHAVLNRTVFARTAVKAAKWVTGKPPGLYGMDDMLSSLI